MLKESKCITIYKYNHFDINKIGKYDNKTGPTSISYAILPRPLLFFDISQISV